MDELSRKERKKIELEKKREESRRSLAEHQQRLQSFDVIQQQKAKRRKVIMIIAAVIIAALVAVLAFAILSPGKYDEFAKCLTEKSVKMYGAYWCPHCANQKNELGSSFKYIDYVECDPNGQNPQPELCKQNGITGYPTWIYNGEKRSGEQSLLSLGAWAGCSLS